MAKIVSHKLKIKEEFTDITNVVRSDIRSYNVQNGTAIIYSRHTTGCIRILEPEVLLKRDMSKFLEKLASKDDSYEHDIIELRSVPPEERRNGFSHLRAMLFNHQEVIPIINGELDLGKWQALYFIECDFAEPIRTDREFKVKLIYDD